MIIKIYADGGYDAWAGATDHNSHVGSAVIPDHHMVALAAEMEEGADSGAIGDPGVAAAAEELARALREAHGKVHGGP